MSEDTEYQNSWYYLKDGAQIGPVSEEELKGELGRGNIHPTTLVWSSHMNEWQAASTVDAFRRVSTTAVVSQVRPWVRYWARMTDVWIFAVFISVYVGISDSSILYATNDMVMGIIILAVWVLIESVMLSTWGTTPGKWFFRITIRDSEGNMLNYSDSLSRCFSVWLKGLGAGLPLVSIITTLIAYNTLTTTGRTSWDMSGNFTVTHEEIGTRRVVFFILSIFAMLFLAALGASEGLVAQP